MTVDFRVYSGQKWDQFSSSHAPDILVHYPDGSTTKGLPEHIAPVETSVCVRTGYKDQRTSHPAGQSRTSRAVEGFMTGTFSRPMDLGGGKTLQPTGKKFNLGMVTIGRWENGLMEEEWLFWDNAAFMKQIGAGQ